jgi:hypothetical protein
VSHCHGNADDKGSTLGAYSTDELRAMKKDLAQSVKDVRAHFPIWQDKERLLVRIGGCYTDTCAPAISINGIPQISLGKDEAGHLSLDVRGLTFELRNRYDELLARMEDNWFTGLSSEYPRHDRDSENH